MWCRYGRLVHCTRERFYDVFVVFWFVSFYFVLFRFVLFFGLFCFCFYFFSFLFCVVLFHLVCFVLCMEPAIGATSVGMATAEGWQGGRVERGGLGEK